MKYAWERGSQRRKVKNLLACAMNVHDSISTFATAYETITLTQNKLRESPTLPHRLCVVLRATSLLGADYGLLGSTTRRPGQ
jgi:hypothetical protein